MDRQTDKQTDTQTADRIIKEWSGFQTRPIDKETNGRRERSRRDNEKKTKKGGKTGRREEENGDVPGRILATLESRNSRRREFIFLLSIPLSRFYAPLCIRFWGFMSVHSIAFQATIYINTSRVSSCRWAYSLPLREMSYLLVGKSVSLSQLNSCFLTLGDLYCFGTKSRAYYECEKRRRKCRQHLRVEERMAGEWRGGRGEGEEAGQDREPWSS